MFTALRKFVSRITDASKQPEHTLKENSDMVYSEALNEAVEFSRSQGLILDSVPSEEICATLVERAIKEIASGLYEQIALYRKQGRNPFMAFGGDCGNVHLVISQFLLNNYPELSPNLVMGSVAFNHKESFNFSQKKFIDWRQSGYGDLFDCHAWVSLGQNWIIDATIGTWVHTRQGAGEAFGGVFYGPPSSIKCVPITNERHVGQFLTGISYRPVVVGVNAFSLVQEARDKSRRDGV